MKYKHEGERTKKEGEREREDYLALAIIFLHVEIYTSGHFPSLLVFSSSSSSAREEKHDHLRTGKG